MIKIIQKFFTPSKSGIGLLEDDVDRQTVQALDLENHPTMEERRQSTRLAVSLPVLYRIRNRWARWMRGKTQDYSNTGVRIALPFGVTKGTEVSLKIKLPDVDRPIDIQGVVVWTAPFVGNDRATIECGVAFKDMRNIPQKDRLVQFIANKLCSLGMEYTKDLTVQPAQSFEDLRSCFSLIYRGYLKRGYCQKNPVEMHYSYYSLLPRSRTFVLRKKENLLGTISLIVDSPCGLPMDTLFKKEIDVIRHNGGKVAEVSLLALDQKESNKKVFSLTNFDKHLRLFRLFKIMYEYARFTAGVTDLIIGVHPKHTTLYNYLQFKPFGPVKDYSGACDNPALPMHLNLIAVEESYCASLKEFFLKEMTPLDVLKGGIQLTDKMIQQLLIIEQNLWPNICPGSQEYIQKCYPHVLSGLSAEQKNAVK